MSYLNNFHYQILNEGSSEKLVFLHGLMGASTNWRKITSQFEKDFCILTYDQRGHGRSFHPKSGYRPEDYADDLLQILDELQWEKITLVGHSMGGRNALNFAHRFSQRIKALVVEDIGPDINTEAVLSTKKLLDLVPTPFSSKQAAKEFLLQEFPKLIPDHPQPMVLAQYFYTNIATQDNGEADWRFFKPGVVESLEQGRSVDRWHELKELKLPCLLVRGQNSTELSHEVYLQMIECNDWVEGAEINNAGHWVHSDQPRAFTECLRHFFQKQGLL